MSVIRSWPRFSTLSNIALQSNRKTEQGTDHSDRDAPFRVLWVIQPQLLVDAINPFVVPGVSEGLQASDTFPGTSAGMGVDQVIERFNDSRILDLPIHGVLVISCPSQPYPRTIPYDRIPLCLLHGLDRRPFFKRC